MSKLFVVDSETDAQDSKNLQRPPDWEERRKALDIRQSWIVEAPAGSGKTGLLIQRYLKLLSDESVEQPEQVLAITFTVKATGEIRERVMAQLERAARNELLQDNSEFERETRLLAQAVVDRDRILGWGLLERPRRLKVRTIDSVCAEIANSLPVLSGGSGQSPVLDASGLHHEAARRTLMQLGGEDAALNAALRTVLLHRDGNLAECERLLASMLALRDQWGELIPLTGRELDDVYLDNTVLPRLQRVLEQAICAGLVRLSQTLPEDILRELSSLAGTMGHASGYKGAASPIAICAGLHIIPGETAEHLAHWRALIHLLTTSGGSWRSEFRSNWLKFDIDKDDAARLKNLAAELHDRDDILAAIKAVNCLPPAKYPHEQWVVAKALFRVLSRALVELQLVFAERSECDFAELGLLAKSALRRDSGVHDLEAALGMKLQHLLVDEMQDTSTSQYELIELLTQNWDGQSQTVFLVGDPKQSIYLFRLARVERFVQTMLTEQLGELPVGSLRLTANFRSQRGLVDAFNDDFSLLFPRHASSAHPEEVEYVPANAVRGASKNGSLNVVWHGVVVGGDEIARRRQAKKDAEAVRKIIDEWQARPLPEGRTEPWKIAVLVRSRNHLTDIVAALKRDDGQGAIPFRAVDIEPLGERREVLDLFALTRALLHPADRVAWFAVLHAPWCGLGLAELHVLAGADDDTWSDRCIQDIMTERGHLLDDESCSRLARIWPVLQAAAAQRGRLTAAQWVERTWRSLGGDSYLQNAEIANARRYLQLLDEIEQTEGTIDLKLLKARLATLFAEAAVTPGAVDLMTIHGAKGLEWDVVIVPGLEKRARVSGGRLLTWNEIGSSKTAAAQVVLAPIPGKGEESKELNNWLNNIEKTRDAAERKRLFYVACTRAREELHLFAAPEAKADGSISPAYGSLLSAAWPAAERNFNFDRESPDSLQEMFVASTTETSSIADAFIGDIAAASARQKPAVLERLPESFSPQARFSEAHRLPYGDTSVENGGAHFERPEGSFEARSFGNAVHGFLDILSRQLAQGIPAHNLLKEIADWKQRISAVLRADGLSRARVERLATRVAVALTNALRDSEGLWILGAHEEASTELALTSWGEARRNVRLDRSFRAGAAPLSTGKDFLWIVDYKTTAHTGEGIEAFLQSERIKYAPQMETYARTMKVAPHEVRMGLYFPMLPKFIWWTLEEDGVTP